MCLVFLPHEEALEGLDVLETESVLHVSEYVSADYIKHVILDLFLHRVCLKVIK